MGKLFEYERNYGMDELDIDTVKTRISEIHVYINSNHTKEQCDNYVLRILHLIFDEKVINNNPDGIFDY